MKQIIQSYRTGELWLADVPVPACKDGGVVVRTVSSFISAGTERMLVDFARKNIAGKALAMPDQVKKVLRKIKSEGVFSTLDKVRAKLDQPIPLGYSCSGIIEEVGRNVSGLSAGDSVACGGAGYANHAEYNYVPKNLVVKIPGTVSFEDASCATVGSIALQGVRQCDLRLGENVCVMGLGLLGLLAVQMFKASGVRVVGYDPNVKRCELARKLGADMVVSESIEEACKEFSEGYGVDAALITAATKSNEPVTIAGEICRMKGKVVVTGLVGMDIPRDMYYKKELDFKLSLSYGPGRYDPHYEESGHDYPYGYVRWTEQRNMKAFLELASAGQILPSRLVTHRFDMTNALDAYELMLGKTGEDYLGIVLNYDPLPGGIGSSATNGSHGAGITTVEHSGREPGSTGQAKIKKEQRILHINGSHVSHVTHHPSPITIGFIGAGNFSKSVLLPNVKKQSGVRLRGICTATGMNAAETGKKEGFEFATTDYKQILDDSEINTVFITTQHNTHAHFVIAALKAGKHVFVEKPLCLNPEELEEIQKLATPTKWSSNFTRQAQTFSPDYSLRGKEPSLAINEKHSKQIDQGGNSNQQFNNSQITSNVVPLLMVGFNRRFSPHAKLIKNYYQDRRTPMMVNYRVNAGIIPPDVWIQDPEIGGGRIIGEVCHFIDFSSFVINSDSLEVQAMCVETSNASLVARDNVSITIKYRDGSVAQIIYVAVGAADLSKEYCEVFADESVAVIDNFCSTVCKGKRGKKKLKGKQVKGFTEEISAFLGAVRDGEPPPIEFQSIVNTTACTFAVLESLQKKKPISVVA